MLSSGKPRRIKRGFSQGRGRRCGHGSRTKPDVRVIRKRNFPGESATDATSQEEVDLTRSDSNLLSEFRKFREFLSSSLRCLISKPGFSVFASRLPRIGL